MRQHSPKAHGISTVPPTVPLLDRSAAFGHDVQVGRIEIIAKKCKLLELIFSSDVFVSVAVVVVLSPFGVSRNVSVHLRCCF